MVWTQPDGKDAGGIAFNSGSVFLPGLYASDPASGSVVRIAPDGSATPVVTGLTNPGALGFSPTTGALWVICDGKNLLVSYSEAAAQPTLTAAEEAAPAEAAPEGTSDRGEVLVSVDLGFTPEPAPAATPRPAGASTGGGRAGGSAGFAATPSPTATRAGARAGGSLNLSGGPSPTPTGAMVVASPVSQRRPTPAVESPPRGARPGLCRHLANELWRDDPRCPGRPRDRPVRSRRWPHRGHLVARRPHLGRILEPGAHPRAAGRCRPLRLHAACQRAGFLGHVGPWRLV